VPLYDSDLVVSGGGSQGITEVAAIRALSRVIHFRRVGGASVGAIIASGLALGFTPDFMVKAFVKLLTRGDLEDWKFPGPFKPLGLIHGRGGMMKGRMLREALTEIFGKACIGEAVLPLRIKVGCLSKRRTETVYSDIESHKKLSIVDVCMCSAAVPGLIDNQQLDPHNVTGPRAANELYCDEGTGNNVPRAIWDDAGDEEVRPTTVVRFVDDEKPLPARTPREKIAAYWNIMRDAAESEVSKKPSALVWDVPIAVDGSAMDFSLTPQECERRVQIGDAAGARWIADNNS